MKSNTSSVSRPVKLLTAVTAVVVVLAILVIMVLNALPSSILEFDMTANDLYSVSSATTDLLNSLTDPIEIRVFTDTSGTEEHFAKFMEKYDALSDKVTVTTYDTVKNPSSLTEYDAESNTVQVCNTATDQTATFSISGFDGQDAAAVLYDYTTYYMYGQLSMTSFDAEGRLASAISSVTGGEQYTIYYTTGHGETTIATTISSLVNKANYAQTTIELLTAGGIPDDCDLLVCNAPTSDLADDELTMLKSWLAEGGKMLLICDDSSLTNFKSLMLTYGIQMEDGHLADLQNYYEAYASQFGYYCFYPVYNDDSDICSGVSSSGMVIGAIPLTLVTPERREAATEFFMSSSEAGVNYVGQDQEDVEYSTYHVGVVATEAIDDETESRLTVISSAYYCSEDVLSNFTSLSNSTVIMNAINANFGDTAAATTIGAKSMSITYNSFTNTTFYSLFFMILVPAAFLVVGIVCCVRRRKQ